MTVEKLIEAKNVEQALKKAAEKYKIPVGKIKHEVVSYGSTGIFGLVGVKKAKIKIFLPDEKPAKKDAEKPAPKREEKPAPKREEKQIPSREAQEETVQDETVQDETVQEEAVAEEKEASVEMVAEGGSEENAIELGKLALQRIIDSITSDATLAVTLEEDQVLFNITGGKAAVLIGKRGQTLEAMQYLVEKIINRSSENRIRIQIDVQGYLQNRRSNLEELAARLAQKVQRGGKPVTAGEMNVQDRKIIHLALKDHPNVRTQSVGSGLYRKLMIFPKKNGGKKKDGPPREK
jgi:spoIIIJ-associated protein